MFRGIKPNGLKKITRICYCHIPAVQTYGVYTSQLIRYSKVCRSYHAFCESGSLLTRKLLYQGSIVAKLNSSLRKFYSRHYGLVNHYRISVRNDHEYVLFVVITIRSSFKTYRRVFNMSNTTVAMVITIRSCPHSRLIAGF